MRPRVMNADAIGQKQDLVEIVADQHDGGAPVARRQQTSMHGGAGADIEAAARTVRQ